MKKNEKQKRKRLLFLVSTTTPEPTPPPLEPLPSNAAPTAPPNRGDGAEPTPPPRKYTIGYFDLQLAKIVLQFSCHFRYRNNNRMIWNFANKMI